MGNMRIKPEEITKIIRGQIENFEATAVHKEVGYVTALADGIATIHGLERAMVGELVSFGEDLYGMVLNLDAGAVGAAIFGDSRKLKEGSEARTTGRVMSVPVGPEVLGRVLNPIGQPLDGKGPLNTTKTRAIERIAAGIVDRQPVKVPLQTGIKAIDSMVPIGRGQRELIIGDRQTGKTAVALDAIINQKETGVKCIYVAIGQKASTVANVVATLEQAGAMAYTTVIASSAADAAPLTYIAPYTGVTMAEELMYEHKADVLIIYDDLSKHAVAYRELSLLLRRPPGREAYPGDVFYVHSRLLERAVKLNDDLGAGSITALPIIETQASDVSAYIPTNVISITDGQIYLSVDLFNSGQRPAIDVGLSVSRVGGSAQNKAMKKVAGTLRLDLAQYNDLAAFAQFGSDLDEASQRQLRRGEKTLEILKQPQFQPIEVSRQVLIIYLVTNGLLDDIPTPMLRKFEAEYLQYLDLKHPEFLAEFKSKRELTDSIRETLHKTADAFRAEFKSQLS